MSLSSGSSPGGRSLRRRLSVIGCATALAAAAGATLAVAQDQQNQQNQQDQQNQQGQAAQVETPQLQQTAFRAVTVPTERRARTLIVPPCPSGNESQSQQVRSIMEAAGDEQVAQQDRRNRQDRQDRQNRQDRENRQNRQNRENRQNRQENRENRQNREDRQNRRQNQQQGQGRGRGVLVLDDADLPQGTNVTVVPADTGMRTVLVPTCAGPGVDGGQAVTVLVLPPGVDASQVNLPVVARAMLAQENRAPGVIIPSCVPASAMDPQAMQQQPPMGRRTVVAPVCQTPQQTGGPAPGQQGQGNGQAQPDQQGN